MGYTARSPRSAIESMEVLLINFYANTLRFNFLSYFLWGLEINYKRFLGREST